MGVRVRGRWYLPIFTIVITIVDILVYYAAPGRGRALAAPLPLEPGAPWLLLSSSLAHADAVHLWGNMFSQLVVGIATEIQEGPVRMLAVYTAAAYFGSFVEAALWTGGDTVLLGASDAIYGITMMGLASLAMNWAESSWMWRVNTLGSYALALALEVWVSASSDQTNIAVVAHAAGAAMGLALGIIVARNQRVVACERIIISILAALVSAAIIVPLVVMVAV